MARFFYSNTISHFLSDSETVIRQSLDDGHLKSHHQLDQTQARAWDEEIALLKSVLKPYKGRGSVYFEYNIPRMGRRIDVAVLIDGVVLILEFKAFQEHYNKSDLAQVWDYALDLYNFHEESHDRYLAPILVSTEASLPANEYAFFKGNMFLPLMANKESLSSVIKDVLAQCKPLGRPLDDKEWGVSRYAPTPTIIEAAKVLYSNHSVEEITRTEGSAENLKRTTEFVSDIIEYSKKHKQKSICFVTGVPGAGKTLVGLNIATNQFAKQEVAVYLSGNFPLVEVLREALARDKVAREKELGNRFTKAKAMEEVKTFIQMIHNYSDTCLEGTKIVDGDVVKDEAFFASVKNSKKHFIPIDHVTIFDEAQRSWTQKQLATFMKNKKGVPDFPYSEPEFLISCLDRHTDWAVIVCLVGGGQEINTGEAGIKEWVDALNRKFTDWHVYISDRLVDEEYKAAEDLKNFEKQENLHSETDLHLAVSMRSFRAEHLSTFVHQMLDGEVEKARKTLRLLDKYPIGITRDVNKAKEWLKKQSGGSERYGIVASSSGERLRPETIVVRLKPSVTHWFLDGSEDIRSSMAMEDVATEFDVQGLELDWACVAWDGDFRRNEKSEDGWSYHQFSGGSHWNNVKNPERRSYRKNAYRVLLTRARQGMVIFVPQGNPEDPTRLPEFYDSTYNYLKSLGLEDIG